MRTLLTPVNRRGVTAAASADHRAGAGPRPSVEAPAEAAGAAGAAGADGAAPACGAGEGCSAVSTTHHFNAPLASAIASATTPTRLRRGDQLMAHAPDSACCGLTTDGAAGSWVGRLRLEGGGDSSSCRSGAVSRVAGCGQPQARLQRAAGRHAVNRC